MPHQNPSPDEIRQILADTKVIAVVGLSDNPARPSFEVASYLQQHGYRILPINPNVSQVLGELAYARLTDAPKPIDVVEIFRRSEAVPEIIEQAIAIGARVIWMQDGVVHEAAAASARQAGLQVVMDRCMLRDHQHLAPRN